MIARAKSYGVVGATQSLAEYKGVVAPSHATVGILQNIPIQSAKS
jgi:hypothetical protein